MTNDAELKTQLQHTMCNQKSVAEFPVKSFGLSPLDSSKLKVEVLYEALLVQHKYGHT